MTTIDGDRERLTLEPHAVVSGGDAIARDENGRVVFVRGAVPGERVIAEVIENHRDFARATMLEVLDASPDRIEPPCANVALGCGGCGWQHITMERQRELRADIVRDSLRRVGRFEEMPDISTTVLVESAYRTTVRVAVHEGRAHFHQQRSDELVPAVGCLVAHPLVGELLDEGYFGSATEAIVRAAVATGERAVLLQPPAARDWSLPDDVDVTTVAGAGRGVVHETVRDRTLRVSITSFFQASPEAAGALVDAVLDGAGPVDASAAVADLYAGVGLFAGAVSAATGAHVDAVERSPTAVDDARHNLAELDARVVRGEVGRWRPAQAYDAVIADPARPGLGRPGVEAVVAARPDRLVLVSCDAASLARDARLLVTRGLRLEQVRIIDAFSHTPHIEAVALFLPV